MSSWFSSLKESATALKESAVKAAESVKQQMDEATNTGSGGGGSGDGMLLQKLTLTTPELMAERQRIDQEERRKEMVRNKLAGLLPWETRDPERDILVEECQQVILKLSHSTSTFTGPWQMPESNVTLEDESSTLKKEDSSDEADDENNDDSAGGTASTSSPPSPQSKNSNKTPAPTPESLEKLAKLSPLPGLLQDFDLDSHVGLIQKCLGADAQLVQQQSQLSGGGVRELIFWKNYFFHCAYSRYEAGLSVDEVWSEEAILRNDEEQQQAALEAAAQKQSVLQSAKAAVMGVVQKTSGNTSAREEGTSGGAGAGESKRALEHEISFEGNEGGSKAEGEQAAAATGAGVIADAAAATAPVKTDGTDDDDAALAEALLQEEAEKADTAAATTTTTATPPQGGTASASGVTKRQEEASPTNTASEYDMVDDKVEAVPADGWGEDGEDPEMDELEAEIARELED